MKDIDQLRNLARDFEPDLYYSALLAPRDAQDDLIVLAVYIAETNRIAVQVQEPTLAEMRVQWWRDALGEAVGGTKSGNPILDAVADVFRRRGISLEEASAPLEAVSREIEGDAFAREEDFIAFLDQGAGGVARMTLKITTQGVALDGDLDCAVSDASHAFGAIRLARRLPELVRLGRGPFPPISRGLRDGMSESAVRGEVEIATKILTGLAEQNFAAARRNVSLATAAQRAAVLPLALVKPYAAKLNSPAHDALQDRSDIAPLNRLLRLWWFAKTGRL